MVTRSGNPPDRGRVGFAREAAPHAESDMTDDNNPTPPDEPTPEPIPAPPTGDHVSSEPPAASEDPVTVPPEIAAAGELEEVEVSLEPTSPAQEIAEVATDSKPEPGTAAAADVSPEHPAPETVDTTEPHPAEVSETPAAESEPDTALAEVTASPISEPTPTLEAEDKPAPKKPRKSAKTPATDPGPAPAEADSNSTPAPDEAGQTDAVPAEPVPESKKKWYAVKVQSGREDSIKAAIERKVRIEGLEEFYGQIVIPVEEINEKKKVKVKVKDKKTGEIETHTQERNVVKKNKKYPGYIFAEVEFNDEILYVFRETSGVGDFVGISAKKTAGGGMERSPPSPMTEREVQSMLTGVPNPDTRRGKPIKTVVKLDFEKGDKVRIKNGAFAGNEGEVKAIIEAKDPTDPPKVTVEVTFWGRPVPVELDYWEVDKV